MSESPTLGVEIQDKDLDRYFDIDKPLFESLSKENGHTSWSAIALSKCLGYSSYFSFFKAINKAQQVCLSLEIKVTEHFRQSSLIDESQPDLRLSRFACYLSVMNADPKKPQVARAQAYFATLAEACRRYIEQTEDIERIVIRDDISDRERSLSSTAAEVGVENYAFFQNAGYRGLYNKNIKQLREFKGIPRQRSPLDFMGKTELAANLFRITQTEEKIKKDKIRGQRSLEKTALTVGKKVRKTMQELSGSQPENLPVAEDIKKIKTGLKSTQKGLTSIDKKEKSPRAERS